MFPGELNTSVPLEESGVEFVFEHFRQHNYSTLFSDDGIEWPMFTYLEGAQGWHRQPFDFYDKCVGGNARRTCTQTALRVHVQVRPAGV